MKKRYRFVRKSYAMRRMAKAIERAMAAVTSKETDRAIEWAAAWGLLCGIITPGVRLKDSEVADDFESVQIDIPSAYTRPQDVRQHASAADNQHP